MTLLEQLISELFQTIETSKAKRTSTLLIETRVIARTRAGTRAKRLARAKNCTRKNNL